SDQHDYAVVARRMACQVPPCAPTALEIIRSLEESPHAGARIFLPLRELHRRVEYERRRIDEKDALPRAGRISIAAAGSVVAIEVDESEAEVSVAGLALLLRADLLREKVSVLR